MLAIHLNWRDPASRKRGVVMGPGLSPPPAYGGGASCKTARIQTGHSTGAMATSTGNVAREHAESTAPAAPEQPERAPTTAEDVYRVSIMVDVVRRAHCVDGASVYGGYVRDLVLRNVIPRDIDVSMPAMKDAETFIRNLACAYTISRTEPAAAEAYAHAGGFSNLNVVVGPREGCIPFVPVTLDVSVGPRGHDIDFTCNLLVISRKDIGLARVPESLRFSPSPLNAVFDDVRATRFSIVGVPAVLTKRRALLVAAKMCRRAASMVSRGWTMVPDGVNFCVSHWDSPRLYAPGGVFPGVTVSRTDMCSICHDQFEGGAPVVVTRCHHTFHCNCINDWLSTGRSICTCPVCRDEMFMIRTRPRADRTDGGGDAPRDDGGEGDSEGDDDEYSENDEDSEDEDDSDYDPEEDDEEIEHEELTLTFSL